MKKIPVLICCYLFPNLISAQFVGINTTTPQAMLHVKDSNVLFSGPNPFVNYAPSSNPPASGPGTRMMWYTQKGAFRAGWVEDNRWDKDSIGIFSIALGHSVLASYTGSVAMGIRTQSRNFASTALGYNTQADGEYSLAAGYESKATGQIATAIGGTNMATGFFSTAIGSNNTVSVTSAMALGNANNVTGVEGIAIGANLRTKARASFVAGWYNDTTDFPDPTFVAPTDRLFQVGNGNGFLATRSNALTILRNGNTGIGTLMPIARLHVADSSVVFTGPSFLTGAPYSNPPISGPGSRTMWYPQKAAFRTGLVFGTQWDNDSIGIYSFSAGLNTMAKGDLSFASGNGNKAMGSFSFAGGSLSKATDRATFAFGEGAEATGYQSVAIGAFVTASGPNSVALGSSSQSTGLSAFASGYATLASGSIASVSGYFAVASGDFSLASGNHTFAKARAATTFGVYNDNQDNPNPSADAPADRVFQIGTGVDNGNRKNALTILRNGNVGIGNIAPDVPLSFVNGYGHKIALFSSGINAQYGLGVQGGLMQIYADYATSDIAFGYGGSTSFTERMRIKGNGNVGIGTTNPVKPLSFPAALGEKILLYPGGTGEVGIGVYGNELRIHSDYAAAKISFGYQDNAGTFTQTMWLNNTTSVLTVGGTAYPSDERFKKQITPIENPLDKLMHLNGVEYFMRKEEFPEMNFSTNRQTGLIAQQVEKVIPSAVYEINEKGYKGVDYAKLVPLLIEAIKEQQKQIDLLKNRLDKIKNIP